MNFAVICAGGKGKRMGAEKNKVFLKLLGKEIIAYTIDAFEKSSLIDRIVLVLPSDDFEEARQIIKREGFKKVVSVVEGGKERQDSVYNGLKEAEKIGAKKGDIILVQDGARPFVSPEMIEKSVSETKKFNASVVGVKAKDTIKVVNEDLLVKNTPDRKTLYNIQTPQTIEFSLMKNAFEKAFAENFYGTDDVMLVERIGGIVKVVEGSYENIKITTPEDIEIGEKILEKRIAFHEKK